MTDVALILEEIDEEQKNKNNVRCQYCNSLILSKKSAKYISKEYALPLMQQKKASTEEQIESESYKDYWTVEDMFIFENIGFSHQVGTTKYLICADCEMGPVGYHDVETKQNYISLVRTKHEHST